MPIPVRDRDVLLDVPQFLLKRMAKVDPSPVSGGDGQGVYYIGKFSDVWADPDQRGKDFYYVHATNVLPVDLRAIKDKLADPLFSDAAQTMCNWLVRDFCGPQSTSYSWNNCLDSAFEGSGSCFPQATASSIDYSRCVYSTSYAPAMFVHSGAPSNGSDTSHLVAYSPPCPVASSAPSLSTPKMSGNVLLRAVACLDTTNSVAYIRYTAQDNSSNSYTIAYLGLGYIQPGNPPSPGNLIRYGLSSSVTKGTTDYYYYIYTIGYQYQ
jgi:hypothetical protein